MSCNPLQSKPLLLVFLSLLSLNNVIRATDEPGTLIWVFDFFSDLDTSPAIGKDNTIYVGELFALDGDTGEQKWEWGTSINRIASPAIGADGTIYTGSIDFKLFALTSSTGAKRWEFSANKEINTSPAIATNGRIYFGSEDSKLYALNGSNKLWEFVTGDDVNSSPAIGANGQIYFGSSDGKVYALNTSNGTLVWEFTTGGSVESSPAIGEDGTVYIGSSDGKLYALDGATGALVWEYATGDDVDSSPAIGSNGNVYVGSKDNHFYAIDASTGSLKWRFGVSGDVESSPAVAADGTVYFGADDDTLYALDGETGTKKWDFTMTQSVVSAPAIGANGVVYVTSQYFVYALQGSAGPDTSSWPMFGQNIRRTRSAGGYSNTSSPVISSSDAFTFSDSSSTLDVATVAATDANGDTLGFHILADGDGQLFSIDRNTGEFFFKSQPDFLNPVDADSDNVYDITVQVHDGLKTTNQAVSISVTLGNPYRSAIAFIVGVRSNATQFLENWYVDQSLGFLYATEDTQWIYQKELGYLYPESDTNWFYSAGELGWLHIQDENITAKELGSTSVLVGYLYSSTKGWVYLSSGLGNDGDLVTMYYDVSEETWELLN